MIIKLIRKLEIEKYDPKKFTEAERHYIGSHENIFINSLTRKQYEAELRNIKDGCERTPDVTCDYCGKYKKYLAGIDCCGEPGDNAHEVVCRECVIKQAYEYREIRKKEYEKYGYKESWVNNEK